MSIKLYSSLIVFFFTLSIAAQKKIEIVDIIEDNKIVSFNNQPLILLDFWATWCGPCIPATNQLEVYQRQLPNDVHMMAFSSENRSVIEDYLTRNTIDLAVVQDVLNKNEQRFNVKSRPYTVIINAKGKLLWKGKPGDLNTNLLKRLASQQPRSNYNLFDVIEFQKQSENPYQLTKRDTADVYLKKVKQQSNDEFFKSETRINFKGKLEELVARTLEKPISVVSSNHSNYVEFSCSLTYWENNKPQLIQLIKDDFQVEIHQNEVLTQVNELKVIDENRLWNTNQINWGNEETGQSLITEDRIKADNFTINQIALLLSDIKNQIFVYTGENTQKYDWDFHFRFTNLMKDELENEFGLQIKAQTNKLIPYYTIRLNGNSQ